MSRVFRLVRPSARRILVAVMSAAMLASVVFALPASAQDLPACDAERGSDCVLPDWSDAIQRDIPSPFGDIEGIVWVEDERGDIAPRGVDILAAGLGRVEVTDAVDIRQSDALLRLGGSKKAVANGPIALVRIVLDRPLDEITDGHSGVHVSTDIDGSRSNNAPAGVGSARNPFAGSQNIYSLTYAATTAKSELLESDLAKGWYKGKGPVAAMWAAPNVLDLVIPPKDLGAGFRVVSFVSGPEGGYDSLALGPAPIAADGKVGLVPVCIEGSLSAEPFTVRRLVENGQTLRDVEAPASWRGGASFSIESAERDALQTVIDAADTDADGLIELASTVSLFEDGIVIRQRPRIGLRLNGDLAQLSVELGLTRRGYNVVRDFELEPTGNATADKWLERASDALTQTMPPFRAAKRAGLVAGDGIGSCVATFVQPPELITAPTAEPAAGDAAASV